jgi:membrane fusion protein (multidrug efflux system)
MKISSFALPAFLCAVVLTGCNSGAPGGAAGGPGAGGARPPADVTVATLKEEPVTLTTELPGRTSAFRVADVRPQVNGVLQKRLFVEGADVQEGQQLYQIDPAPYQAALDTELAALQKAQANENIADVSLKRDQGLLASHAVSQQDIDNAVATYQEAQADVASANAAIETARINLQYTKVLSPITGRTGRSITEGALVTASQTQSLVTIQQLDPIYVDVSQSISVLLRLERELAAGQIRSAGDNQAQVRLKFEDGSDYDQAGQLQFSETNVDQATGSVILRAIFPNPKHLLLPGMFVRAEIDEGVNENGILVPQQAVTHDVKGNATAYVVTPDNKVELRTLQTTRAIGDKWLVSSGVAAGERVVVEGLQKIQPGAEVNPTEWTPPAAEAAPAPSTASTP